MKKPFLIALAVWLMALPAFVRPADGNESGKPESVAPQIFYNLDDGTHDDSKENGTVSYQKFTFEICGDPTRMKDMALQDIEEKTSKEMGCTILYNVDW
jgi:hypothetical protein